MNDPNYNSNKILHTIEDKINWNHGDCVSVINKGVRLPCGRVTRTAEVTLPDGRIFPISVVMAALETYNENRPRNDRPTFNTVFPKNM